MAENANTAAAKRSRDFNPTNGTTRLLNDIKESVNGVLAHELSVGDAAYIKPMNKIAMPFDPYEQYRYTLIMGATIDQAKLLTIARMGLLAYWGTFLNKVDVEESVDINQFLQDNTIVDDKGTTKVTPNDKANPFGIPLNRTIPTVDIQLDLTKIDNFGTHTASGLNYKMIFLHMKDIGMLVAANLVRTGHHYQKATNGAFRALERKRFDKEVFSDEDRGILYHEAIHCFTQIAKGSIYAKYLQARKDNALAEPFTLLDPVIQKRLPVVPSGAAWLSAGVTIMNEVVSIPKINEKIPKEYASLIDEATEALKAAMLAGRADTSALAKFEGMAAFAHGVLSEIAPSHSAVKAPSLLKLSEQHIGAKAAGSELGRRVLRAE